MSIEQQERVSALLTKARDEMIQTRSLLQGTRLTHGWRDRIEPVEGLLTCGIVTLYGRIEELREFEIRQDDHKFGESLKFSPRGVGSDTGPGCFVCGDRPSGYMANVAAFVKSRDEGSRIVEWFNDLAWLDFRESEPDWLQVKVCACKDHLPNLHELERRTRAYCVIRKADIVAACEFQPDTP